MSRWPVFILFPVLFVAGCASINGKQAALAGRERVRALAAFTAFAADQGRCPAAIEAAFSADFDSFWRNARADGEVRIRQPAEIKLTAVDPLGRPLLIVASDGSSFVAVNVAEATVYTGELSARKVASFMPAALVPDLFYLMIGRLPPGELLIREISAGPEEGLVRISFSPAARPELVREVVFDPGAKKIRSQAVFDTDGKLLLTVNYSRFLSLGCEIPATVELVTPKGRLSLNLEGPGEINGSGGFDLSWPPIFKQVVVK